MDKFTKLLSLALILFHLNLGGQCSVTSTGANPYTVNISVTPTSLIKPMPCPNINTGGYNYNLTLNYTLTFTGTNPPSNLWSNRVEFKCGTSVHGINISTTPTTNTSINTTTNPWRPVTDCATSTVTSLNCTTYDIILHGPDIPNQTITCNAVLPINLIKFSGKFIQNKNNISLNWTTASEENGSHFDILRSEDGIHFEKIGQIASQQNSRIKNEYEFVDGNFNDAITYYYQLKMVDLDESYKLSDIVSVQVARKNFSQLMATPNPSENGVFNLFIPVELATESKSISVYNQSMQLILDQYINSGATKVDLSNQTNGIYFLKVGSSVTKLVKTN